MNKNSLGILLIAAMLILAGLISLLTMDIIIAYVLFVVIFSIIAWYKTMHVFIGYLLVTPIWLVFARNILSSNFVLASSLKEAALIILFIIVLIKVIKNKDFSKLKTPFTIPILTFCLVCTLNLFVADNFLIGLQGLRIWLMFVPIFFMTLVLIKREHLPKIIILMLLCAMVFMASGIFQYLFFPQTTYTCAHGTCFQRMGTFYIGPPFEGNGRGSNEFAIYLMLSLPIAFTLLLNKKLKQYRFALFLPVLLSLVCVILSMSRKVWIGLFCAAILVIILRHKRAIIYAILILLIVYFLLPGFIGARMESITSIQASDEINNNLGRLEIWQDFFDVLKTNWLFGLGPGSAGSVDLKLNPENPFLAHNTYLNIWIQFGLLSLLAFIGIIVSVIKVSLASINRINNIYNKNLLIGIIASLTALLIAGFFGDVFDINASLIFFWFYLGLIIIITRKENSNEDIYL